MARAMVWLAAMLMGLASLSMPAVAAPIAEDCTCMTSAVGCDPVMMTMGACQQCCFAALPSIALVSAAARGLPVAPTTAFHALASMADSLDPPPPRRG